MFYLVYEVSIKEEEVLGKGKIFGGMVFINFLFSFCRWNLIERGDLVFYVLK